MIDWISSIFLIAGGFFAFIAGLGLLRFPDLLSRMHAATKASGAAFSLILVAFVLRLPEWDIAIKAILSLFLAFLTLPVAAHLLGRSTSRGEDREE
ncbi:MAG: monovalent cation/H(+) antiporter subunit G [Verrucomicrobiota bacterium]